MVSFFRRDTPLSLRQEAERLYTENRLDEAAKCFVRAAEMTPGGLALLTYEYLALPDIVKGPRYAYFLAHVLAGTGGCSATAHAARLRMLSLMSRERDRFESAMYEAQPVFRDIPAVVRGRELFIHFHGAIGSFYDSVSLCVDITTAAGVDDSFEVSSRCVAAYKSVIEAALSAPERSLSDVVAYGYAMRAIAGLEAASDAPGSLHAYREALARKKA